MLIARCNGSTVTTPSAFWLVPCKPAVLFLVEGWSVGFLNGYLSSCLEAYTACFTPLNVLDNFRYFQDSNYSDADWLFFIQTLKSVIQSRITCFLIKLPQKTQQNTPLRQFVPYLPRLRQSVFWLPSLRHRHTNGGGGRVGLTQKAETLHRSQSFSGIFSTDYKGSAAFVL